MYVKRKGESPRPSGEKMKKLWLPLLLMSTLAFAGKDDPKACVKFAKTWDLAVEEAKLLNTPIVVHSHGFY